MPKIIISGCNGRMGQTVTRLCGERGMEVVAGIDVNAVRLSDYPVYADPMEYGGTADVLVDFSISSSLTGLLDFCKSRRTPCVLCTTGYDEAQIAEIEATSREIPVFRSGNMSLGVNLLVELVKKASAVLGDSFDVEIVEKHHRMKVDAPSGTAVMLADAAASALPHDSEYVYERQSVRQKRGQKEIGISSVRGGTIVGEHDVIFAGTDEVLELRHIAQSRDVFAAGAVKAAEYMAGIKSPGLYDMRDVLSQVLGK